MNRHKEDFISHAKFLLKKIKTVKSVGIPNSTVVDMLARELLDIWQAGYDDKILSEKVKV